MAEGLNVCERLHEVRFRFSLAVDFIETSALMAFYYGP